MRGENYRHMTENKDPGPHVARHGLSRMSGWTWVSIAGNKVCESKMISVSGYFMFLLLEMNYKWWRDVRALARL